MLRVRRLPNDYVDKIKFILTASMSGGLYGCEATWANEGLLASLTTAVANTVSPPSTMRCNQLLFSSLQAKQEIDPCALIFLRRIGMFRRMMVKNPSLLGMRAAFLTNIVLLNIVALCTPHVTSRAWSRRRPWELHIAVHGSRACPLWVPLGSCFIQPTSM